MKLLYATDLHGNKKLYEDLFKFAVDNKLKTIILGGDITPHGGVTLEEAVKVQRDFLEKYLIPKIKKSGLEVFTMMANDDFRANMDLLEKADKEGILNLMHLRLRTLKDNSFDVIGYSFVNPIPFRLKDWEKGEFEPLHRDGIRSTDIIEKTSIQDDMERIAKTIKPKRTIFVCHVPPFNTKLDQTHSGVHAGSKAVKLFIEKYKPKLALHGHIHESFMMTSYWKQEIGETLCINPGSEHIRDRLNCVIIDLDDLAKCRLKLLE